MRLGLYERALDVLLQDYPAVPADQREPAEAAPQNHPLVAYYRGYCRQQLGHSPAEDYSAAARLSTDFVFPSGSDLSQPRQRHRTIPLWRTTEAIAGNNSATLRLRTIQRRPGFQRISFFPADPI